MFFLGIKMKVFCPFKRVGPSFVFNLLSKEENIQLTDNGDKIGRSKIGAILSMSPTTPVFNEDGSYVLINDAIGEEIYNPVAYANEVTDNGTSLNILGNIFAEIKLAKGLTYSSKVGADYLVYKNNFYLPRNIGEGQGVNGEAKISGRKNINLLNTNILTYTTKLNSRDQLTLTAVAEFQRFKSENSSIRVQGFANDELTYNDLSAAAIQDIPASSGEITTGLTSYLLRGNYNIHSKYLVTVSARLDGSSKFGEDNKYALFPSSAVAWIISNEEFMKNSKYISNLKLRTSYGITGSQEIPAYRSLGLMGSVDYPFGDQLMVGFVPVRVQNPDLKWETTKQYDVGLDIGLFKNRISLTADYYYKKTTDLLLDVPIPRTSGFSSSLQNIGSLQNQGFELTINSVNVKPSSDFEWRTMLNLSFNKNKVLELSQEADILVGLAQSEPYGIIRKGEAIGSFYGYITNGIYQTQEEVDNSPESSTSEPGELKYVDITNDGAVTPEDRVILGNSFPDVAFGLTNSFRYKKFDFSFMFQGTFGNETLNLNQLNIADRGRTNKNVELLNRWTGPGTSNSVPKANTSQLSRVVDIMVEDGSFVRLQNLTVGYNFEASKLKWCTGGRMYLSGQNLFCINNYSGYDPEIGSPSSAQANNLAQSLGYAVDFYAYPTNRMYMVGLQINF